MFMRKSKTDTRNFMEIPNMDSTGNWGEGRKYKRLSHCKICGNLFDKNNTGEIICPGCIARQRMDYLQNQLH